MPRRFAARLADGRARSKESVLANQPAHALGHIAGVARGCLADGCRHVRSGTDPTSRPIGVPSLCTRRSEWRLVGMGSG